MATNGAIGPFSFAILNPLDGDIEPPQVEWRDVSEPWEDGVAYTRGPKRSMVKRYQALADLDSNTRQNQIAQYMAFQELGVPTVMARVVGAGTEYYPGIMVVKVEVVNANIYAPVASGGLTAGKYIVETIWHMQYTLGA